MTLVFRYFAIVRSSYFLVCFFFQAEDGIRYWSVTGVQTCALPISRIALLVRESEFGLGIDELIARTGLAEPQIAAPSIITTSKWCIDRSCFQSLRDRLIDRKSVV